MTMEPAEKKVVVSIAQAHYHTTITTRTHMLVADEPTTVGGGDEGPSPGDFLRISLATCTAITLRMYADRKKYDVRQIDVAVETETIDNKTVFHRTIVVHGSITEEERARLLVIADKCPTHKVLTNPIEIHSDLKLHA